MRVGPAPCRRAGGQPAAKMTELAVYFQEYRNTNQQPVLVDNPRPELVTRNADGSLDLSYERALGWVRKAFKGSDFKLSVGLTVGCKFPVNDDDEFQRQLRSPAPRPRRRHHIAYPRSASSCSRTGTGSSSSRPRAASVLALVQIRPRSASPLVRDSK